MKSYLIWSWQREVICSNLFVLIQTLIAQVLLLQEESGLAPPGRRRRQSGTWEHPRSAKQLFSLPLTCCSDILIFASVTLRADMGRFLEKLLQASSTSPAALHLVARRLHNLFYWDNTWWKILSACATKRNLTSFFGSFNSFVTLHCNKVKFCKSMIK